MIHGESDDRAQCSFVLRLSAGKKEVYSGDCARTEEEKDKSLISTQNWKGRKKSSTFHFSLACIYIF